MTCSPSAGEFVGSISRPRRNRRFGGFSTEDTSPLLGAPPSPVSERCRLTSRLTLHSWRSDTLPVRPYTRQSVEVNVCKGRMWVALWTVVLLFAGGMSSSAVTGKEVAWNLIMSGLQSNSGEQRVAAVRVLGLLADDSKATELGERALGDVKPEVRTAAATALGQMHSTASIPKLRQALADKEIPVVLAAARALHEMKDKAGFEVYYEILTGERKGSESFIAEQTAILHDPKKLAEMGFEQGIGFIPYAGMGWDALRTILKNDSSPIRAAAATMLTHDPDPESARALVNATRDKNWIVRVAALEALSNRGDPTLRSEVEPSMYDTQREVRYAAAATVLHLADLTEAGKPTQQARASFAHVQTEAKAP
jgi:HEAT repeat protein